MNSKERAQVAMSGGTPDRVPVIPQICPPHSITAAGLPYREAIVDRLRNPRTYDLLEAECAVRYGVDGVRVWAGGGALDVESEGDRVYQVDPETRERIGIVDFMGGGGSVLLPGKRRKLTDEDVEAIAVVPADQLLQSEAMVPMRKVVEAFGDKLFIMGVVGAFTVQSLYYAQGIEETLMDVLLRPAFVKRHAERVRERATQTAIAMAKAGVDALYIGDTFGQFLKPAWFRDLCLPYFQQFVEDVRPYGKLTYLHMCGSITHLLDLVPETGVDCFEPLDPLGGVSVAEVKRRIGGKVALMGGVDTRLLAHGTLEQVKEDCARCVGEGAPGGGYILACGDMLPTETSPEKVRAMVEAAETMGRYQ